MISVRIFLATAIVAVIVGFAAGAFRARTFDRQPPPATPVPEAQPLAGEPIAPERHPELARPGVPAGILARAAEARALERGPSCPPPARRRDVPRCVPEERESIDIEWHVARDP